VEISEAGMSHEQPAVTRGTSTVATGEFSNELSCVGGKIKWFDPRKGYGFVVGPEGQDIFVHFSVIEQSSGFRTLKDGQEVIYSAHSGEKGWTATFVRAATRHGSEDSGAPSARS
jgi:cold shock protein